MNQMSDLIETNTKPQSFINLVSCIDVNHSKKIHDIIFIENIENSKNVESLCWPMFSIQRKM